MTSALEELGFGTI